MKRISYAIVITAIVASCAGCGSKPSGDEKILARVSNKSVTLKEFKHRISKVPPYYQNIADKNKKRFLDEMIVEMLFYEEAVRKGLDRDREVREIIDEAKKKILIAKLIKNEVEDKIVVDDDEIKSFYETRKDDFKTPELWRASHILVATELEAKTIREEISKGANFEELARARSMDATASRGGDIGYFRKGQLVPEFENACLSLKMGELSDVVHTQFGYHIIKLTDKREPASEVFEKARQRIVDELKKKKRSELFDKLVLNLKEKYKVHIQEDVFKSLEKLDEEKGARAK